MLVDFQQALADLTASPELCNAVRDDALVLQGRYQLSARETRRLLAIVHHPGMACACTLYRVNRLAPLAMNLRATLQALGPELRRLVSDYWAEHPQGHAHFFIETERFCSWLGERIGAGEDLPAEVAQALAIEAAAVSMALAESRTEDWLLH